MSKVKIEIFTIEDNCRMASYLMDEEFDSEDEAERYLKPITDAHYKIGLSHYGTRTIIPARQVIKYKILNAGVK